MVVQIRELDRSDWRLFFSLNDQSPQCSVFCTESWIETASSVVSPKQEIKIFVAEIENKIVAGCLIMVSLGRKKSLTDLPFTPYTGVVIADSITDPDVIREIEDAFIRNWIPCYSFRLKLSPDYSDPRNFLWNRMTLRPHWTFRITKSQWRQQREKIKQDKSLGDVDRSSIIISDDVKLLQSFWRITYNSGNCPTTDKFLESLIRCKWATFYISQDSNGVPCCGMLYLRYRHIGYGCATFHHGTVGAEYDRLRFHIFDTEFNDQIELFDWCGANVSKRNSYKADFLPTLVPYYQLAKDSLSYRLGNLVGFNGMFNKILRKVKFRG